MAEHACNGMLCKLNQNGTVSGTIEAVKLCQAKGWGIMVSHRSGETEDNYIADFAVGLNCEKIKCGSPIHSERLAKYNQLIRIEQILGSKAVYAGKDCHN